MKMINIYTGDHIECDYKDVDDMGNKLLDLCVSRPNRIPDNRLCYMYMNIDEITKFDKDIVNRQTVLVGDTLCNLVIKEIHKDREITRDYDRRYIGPNGIEFKIFTT